MDRHDVPGATAEETAQNHVADLENAGTYDVDFFSYWHDSERGVVICLARAPGKEAMAQAHEVSHGDVPTEIIEVSEDDVVRFLGLVHDPVDASEAKSAFRTISFTDIVGSTALLNELGQSTYMDLLIEHDLIVRNALLKHHGREVKHTGDGFMVVFAEVVDALQWATEVRDTFDAHDSLRIRMGMDAGEPVDRDTDLFGAAVTTASRICDAALPQHIAVSQAVRDIGMGLGFSFGQARPVDLKGFAEPFATFDLVGQP